MNCKACNDKLSLYLDQEVTPEERVQIDAHLKTCDACRKEYEELKKVQEMLKELPMKELPEGFEAELHEKLIQAKQEMKQTPKHENTVKHIADHFRRNIKRYSLAVAACLIVLVSYESLGPTGMIMTKNAPMETAVEYDGGMTESAPTISLQEADTNFAPATEEFQLTDEEMAAESVAPEMERGEEALDAVGAMAEEPTSEMPSVSVTSKDRSAQTNRKIIQTGYISMDIEDYDATLESIMDMTVKMGGYVEDMSTRFQYGYRTENPLKMGHVTIRIPQMEFQGVMRTLDEFGQITDQNMTAEDITHQYRDMANEVANLEVREAKLREIMEKAEEIKDVLQVESELSRVRGQINQLKGTLIQWDQLVSLSRITINLYEVESLEVHIEPIDNSLTTRIREAFIHSINNLRYSLENLAILLVALFPFLIGYSIVGYIGWRIVRRGIKSFKNRRK